MPIGVEISGGKGPVWSISWDSETFAPACKGDVSMKICWVPCVFKPQDLPHPVCQVIITHKQIGTAIAVQIRDLEPKLVFAMIGVEDRAIDREGGSKRPVQLVHPHIGPTVATHRDEVRKAIAVEVREADLVGFLARDLSGRPRLREMSDAIVRVQVEMLLTPVGADH